MIIGGTPIPKTYPQLLEIWKNTLESKAACAQGIISVVEKGWEADDNQYVHYGYLTFLAEELERRVNEHHREERKR